MVGEPEHDEVSLQTHADDLHAQGGIPRDVWAIFATPAGRALVAIIAGSTLSLAGLLVYFSSGHQVEEVTEEPLPSALEIALAALDSGSLLRAQRLAVELANSDLADEELGGPSFILGAIAAGDAERLWGQDQRRYFKLATRYLQEAQKLGFPAGREGEGMFLLGKSQYMSGEIAASRTTLNRALAAYPEQAVQIHRLLAAAYSADPEPDLEDSLFHIGKYLADPDLPRNDRAEGWLLKAQTLFQLERTEECRDALRKIDPATEPGIESLIVQGELLMREGKAIRDNEKLTPEERDTQSVLKYSEAINTLRRAQHRGTERDRLTRRSMLLVGHCLVAMNDLRAAFDQYRRTREAFDETDEGIAAGIEQALLTPKLGLETEVLDIYLAVLRAAGPGELYYNPLLPLPKLKSRLLEAYQRFLTAGEFDNAVKLAQGLHPLLPLQNSVALVAQAHLSWAASLESQASKSSGEIMLELVAQAREQRRQAGAAFAKLAELRFATNEYTEDVWNSAENYLRGHEYLRSIQMLREYLQYELRRRRPRALLDLGDSLFAIGEPEKALLTLQECIDNYPRDPSSYRARLVAAKAYTELGSLDQAKRLLLANLEGTELTPDSVEWRDALFSLGSLLNDEAQLVEAQAHRDRADGKIEQAELAILKAIGLYEEATRRLEEAVARYPEVPQVIESRYVIGESYRSLAKFAKEKMEQSKVESSRQEHGREMQRLLAAAIDEYEAVQELLSRRREKSALTPLEQAILRNCYFARGSGYYELGRLDAAITAYSAATNRYQNEPEVLDAFLQLANCYRQLGRIDEARGVIEQARLVLNRIPNEALFERTTIHSRENWAGVLDWLSSLVGAPTASN